MEFEKISRCVLHLKGGNLPGKGYIQEIYELNATDEGCLLTQTILIDQAGILFPRSIGIIVRQIIGRSSARRYLQKLKRLAESSGHDQAGLS